MTLDRNKNLWIAHYHGARISVLNTKAKLIHSIYLPAKNITNCAFGGQKNDQLFVTTATKGLNKADLQKFKYSGCLFSVKTNTKGILQKKFIIDMKKRDLYYERIPTKLLREDIRFLGTFLGRVIKDQEGEVFLK